MGTDVLPVRNWLPRLLPFIASSLFFIVFYVDQLTGSKPSVAFWKCVPIISLIYFVLGQKENDKIWLSYRKTIIIGLVLGCVGDACLVFEDNENLFVCGMVSFAIGHVFYIYGMGFTPLKLGLGLFLYGAAAILLLMIRDNAPTPLVRDAMPFYSLFLVTMLWRSLARLNETLPRKAGAFGGILFIISDFILVQQLEHKMKYGDLFVITTYYLSQLGTALRVLEITASATPKKMKKATSTSPKKMK